MRISDHFSLGRSQPTLDFVDVDIHGDVPVFVDPRALRLLPSEWGAECVALVQSFFHTVLIAIQEKRDQDARSLLRVLKEPNETHLGLSAQLARGRAIGGQLSEDVWEALSRSEAVTSGLLEDLEDTILMVEGIADDIVSDITTNIIRGPLIHYTQDACRAYGIPLTPDVDSGPLWEPAELKWYSEFTELPVIDDKKRLLVPKAIVRQHMDFNADEYYRHFLLEHLMDVELSANSELVYTLRDGRRRVNKKDLEEKYGRGKRVIVRETLNHPDALRKYRQQKGRVIRPPLSHEEIAESEGGATPDWDGLLEAVLNVPSGRPDADRYLRAVETLLSALFYPALGYPNVEHKIHDGRKRIDITYTNMAQQGFFAWLASHYPAPHIFVECKNYGHDVANPELDQLAGRFSPSRGTCGLLLCRDFENKELFLQRCRDTADDDRGFIMLLDDTDLRSLVEARKSPARETEFALFKTRFDLLIM